jgi:hypothetical protein
MRPPVCAICDQDLVSGGGTVRFVSRDSDLAWRVRAQQPGFVGHPPDTEWFCDAHIAAARQRAATLTIDVALREIRELVSPATDGTRRDTSGETAAINWPEIGAVELILRDNFAELARILTLADAPVTTNDERRWMPADGAVPPDCPFILTSTRRVVGDDQSLELRFERSHLSESDIARASIELVARGRKEFSIRGDIPVDGSSLSVAGLTVTGADVGLVNKLVSDISAPSSHRR